MLPPSRPCDGIGPSKKATRNSGTVAFDGSCAAQSNGGVGPHGCTHLWVRVSRSHKSEMRGGAASQISGTSEHTVMHVPRVLHAFTHARTDAPSGGILESAPVQSSSSPCTVIAWTLAPRAEMVIAFVSTSVSSSTKPFITTLTWSKVSCSMSTVPADGGVGSGGSSSNLSSGMRFSSPKESVKMGL